MMRVRNFYERGVVAQLGAPDWQYRGHGFKSRILHFQLLYETTINSTTNTIGQEVTKGKSGKMAAGAIIGTALMPGVGTVIGAAV